jgi:hypothetical protein
MSFDEWLATNGPRNYAYHAADLFMGWNAALKFGLEDLAPDIALLRSIVRDEMAARVQQQLTTYYNSEQTLIRLCRLLDRLHVQVSPTQPKEPESATSV